MMRERDRKAEDKALPKQHGITEQDLLWLSVGIVDTELKTCDLPAAEIVDENRLRTNVAVNEMNTVVKEAKAFNYLHSNNFLCLRRSPLD